MSITKMDMQFHKLLHNDKILTSDDFIESIDPGLLTYKEELYMRSVTSLTTLKFLRPREVQDMNIPDVFKRLLIDKIISLQSPETKKTMKEERSPFNVINSKSECTQKNPRMTDSLHPKRLKFTESRNSKMDGLVDDSAQETVEKPVDKPAEKSVGYLENELKRLKDERDTLSLLLVHKKDEHKTMLSTPIPPRPLAIPGNKISKLVCDNCHHKGHRSYGNKGNKSCPFLPCSGYHYCGILNKHKEYKQEISEAEKEISNVEKEIKSLSDQIENIKRFLIHNSTNFIVSVKPKLKATFPNRYAGKSGAQTLQKDLRFMKIATGGKIPSDLDTMSKDELEKLITVGKSKIFTTYGSVEEPISNTDSPDLSVPVLTNTPIHQNLQQQPRAPCVRNTVFQNQPCNVNSASPSLYFPSYWSSDAYSQASQISNTTASSNLLNNQWYSFGTPVQQSPFMYIPVHGPPSSAISAPVVHGPPSATITSPPDNSEEIIYPPLPNEVPPCQPPLPDNI